MYEMITYCAGYALVVHNWFATVCALYIMIVIKFFVKRFVFFRSAVVTYRFLCLFVINMFCRLCISDFIPAVKACKLFIFGFSLCHSRLLLCLRTRVLNKSLLFNELEINKIDRYI